MKKFLRVLSARWVADQRPEEVEHGLRRRVRLLCRCNEFSRSVSCRIEESSGEFALGFAGGN